MESKPSIVSISDLLLFVSKFSQSSIDTMRDIERLRVPMVSVKIIRVDSPEVRDKITKGNIFQISSVPTLVVVSGNGTISLYSGREKIVVMLCSITNTPHVPEAAPLVTHSSVAPPTPPNVTSSPVSNAEVVFDTHPHLPNPSAPKSQTSSPRAPPNTPTVPRGKKSRSENSKRSRKDTENVESAENDQKRSRSKSGATGSKGPTAQNKAALFPNKVAESPMKKVMEEAERMRRKRAEDIEDDE